jgi:hypothetical protein
LFDKDDEGWTGRGVVAPSGPAQGQSFIAGMPCDHCRLTLEVEAATDLLLEQVNVQLIDGPTTEYIVPSEHRPVNPGELVVINNC